MPDRLRRRSPGKAAAGSMALPTAAFHGTRDPPPTLRPARPAFHSSNRRAALSQQTSNPVRIHAVAISGRLGSRDSRRIEPRPPRPLLSLNCTPRFFLPNFGAPIYCLCVADRFLSVTLARRISGGSSPCTEPLLQPFSLSGSH